jgi:hypothetical protein
MHSLLTTWETRSTRAPSKLSANVLEENLALTSGSLWWTP